jgi:FkbM family methyltransferase
MDANASETVQRVGGLWTRRTARPTGSRVSGVSLLRSAVVSRLPRPVVRWLRAAKRRLRRNWVDEAEIVASLASTRLGTTEPLLVDVGAHYGAVTALFLEKGWSVVAYEPDPVNREQFERHVGGHPRLQLSAAAVSDKPGTSVPLFTSSVSTGISTLAAFHESHKPSATVDVVTLAEDLRARHVNNVDFLKVDVEGFDYFALKGFDWSYAPRFVLYEFEDRKTIPLGYSLAESSAYVAERGYHLVYSVWEPIVEYGSRHRWRCLYRAPPSDVANCWGNVLCFRDEADAALCMRKFGSRSPRLFGRRGHD